MLIFSSTRTLGTFIPSISAPRILSATRPTSCGDSPKRIPPAFPLPATRIWAFTMTGTLSLAAIALASAGEEAISPFGTGISYWAKIFFASYSESFNLLVISFELFQSLYSHVWFCVLNSFHGCQLFEGLIELSLFNYYDCIHVSCYSENPFNWKLR